MDQPKVLDHFTSHLCIGVMLYSVLAFVYAWSVLLATRKPSAIAI